jgi:beta-1,2-mannobiose phosphorylase / 1,2-beta-oligomannan phosphorylase
MKHNATYKSLLILIICFNLVKSNAQQHNLNNQNNLVNKSQNNSSDFPPEITEFTPYENNPIFSGTGLDTWDNKIRERGYILREDNIFHLWYTGYNDDRSNQKYLGYATSEDGIVWKRSSNTPIFDNGWVEDVFVIKHGEIYYLFAEGENDISHMLTSTDRINWQDQGSLDIRKEDNSSVVGPYGTPTVWIENDIWYLFYEKNDEGVWLATSTDLIIWKNVQDEPVLNKGPEQYDQYAVALDQVIKYNGKYYGYYHGNASMPWRDWSTNIAVSTDLIHWDKYVDNPILLDNKSSGTLVWDGKQYRLYSAHPSVHLHFPSQSTPVELSSFSGDVRDGCIELFWTTTSESQNYGFNILRSSNNISFTEIGFVKGSGTSNCLNCYSFMDKDVETGNYYYQLKQCDINGKTTLSEIISVNFSNPPEYQLHQNYPNPFNSSTKIRFELVKNELVKIELYNSSGKKIETLLNKKLHSGNHQIVINTQNLPSGVYFYKMRAGNFHKKMKMLHLK